MRRMRTKQKHHAFEGKSGMFTHTSNMESASSCNDNIDMTAYPAALQRLHDKCKINSELTENEKFAYAYIQIIEEVKKDPAKRVLLTPTMRYFYEKAMGNTELAEFEKTALSYIAAIDPAKHFCLADTYFSDLHTIKFGIPGCTSGCGIGSENNQKIYEFYHEGNALYEIKKLFPNIKCNDNKNETSPTYTLSFWKNVAIGGMVAVSLGISLCALKQSSHK